MEGDGISRVLGRLGKRSALEKARKVDVPAGERMLAITRETGELIDVLLTVMGAKNVLEVGTSAGYSTLWCAGAVRRGHGMIVTVERDRAKIDRARKNFADAGVSEIIDVEEGEAADVLGRLNGDGGFLEFFDFALIDADKENAIRYFDLTVPLVRRGGVIMTDNMLYPEKYRKDMGRLARHIRGKPGIKTITCPVGNGEEISVRA